MRLAPFAPDDLFAFDAQGAQRDMLRFMTREIAEAAAQHPAFTGFDETGRIIGCAGIAPIPDAEGGEDDLVAWAVFSDRLAAHALVVTRAILRLFALYSQRRIVAHIWPEHVKAARFAKALGFRFDREDARIHPSGETMHVYVRE